MIRIYTCEQVSEQLKEVGINVSGKTILHWLEIGKVQASVLHEAKKISVRYFTESDIEKIIESKTPKRKVKEEKKQESKKEISRKPQFDNTPDLSELGI